MAKKKKKEIVLEDIQNKELSEQYHDMWDRAIVTQRQRTKDYTFFSKISHMQPLIEDPQNNTFSEGTTQAIKRKLRNQTLQRVPDGQIITSYDKNSIEQVEIDFLFKNKILTSEYDGKDMLKNLIRVYDASYDYGFACVRTGLEKDLDGDYRISFKIIHWNDIYPAPDADYIEEANWYLIREYVSRSDLEQLISEGDVITDSTYNEDVVRFLLENEIKSGEEANSRKLQDKEKGVSKIESVEVWTIYERGKKEFNTFVPSIDCVLRTVKNYDPRKDVPIHFCILEPDDDFAMGVPLVMWTLAQQQFADAFQSLSYQTLMLAQNPPIMTFGNLTNAKLAMRPRSIWNMGTNPNNKVEKFPVETTTLTQYGSILQNVSGSMMKNLNVTDSTVASDAEVMNYSGTPQGVEAQQQDKTITVNNLQKRIEVFFAEWANHALRSYINAMGNNEIELTVDEETRRKINDIEQVMSKEYEKIEQPVPDTIIDGNKIKINFENLSNELLEFKVRAGSLIQSRQEEELETLMNLMVPMSQMMGNISDQNKDAFEQNLMQICSRVFELSDIDISQQTASRIDDKLIAAALEETMKQTMNQDQQIQQLQQQMQQVNPNAAQEQQMLMQQQQSGMPPDMQQIPQSMPPQEGMPPEQGMPPMPQEGMPPEQGGQESMQQLLQGIESENPQMPPEMAQGAPMPAEGGQLPPA